MMKSKFNIKVNRHDKIDSDFEKFHSKLTNVTKCEDGSVKDLYLNFVQKNSDENEFLYLPLKIIQNLGESIENGSFFSKNFFIRKEIW
jgi:hypothetical protein